MNTGITGRPERMAATTLGLSLSRRSRRNHNSTGATSPPPDVASLIFANPNFARKHRRR
jgi:hypothetical protein